MKLSTEQFLNRKHIVWLIVLVFLLILSPWALQFLMFFPDENHYSDAAMYMIEHGDYLTPHRADGSLRFNKPILNYWVVLSSYRLFGISQWSTRLPFLLCGGAILLLVHQIGKTIFKNRTQTLIPVLIVAANPLFAFTITKSITDTYLLLFVTLTMLGVIGLLSTNESKPPKRFLWALYLGIGFATMTKGIPAIVFGGIGVLYLLLNPWKRYKLLQLLHLPSIFVGASIALFWYIMIYVQHGETAIQEFFGDQVGERFQMTFSHFISNLFGMLLATLICFSPFVFLVFQKGLQFSKREKAILFFAIFYYGLLLIMASFTASFYYRYLLQGFTVVAVALSLLFSKITDSQALKGLKRSNNIALGLFLFLAVATLFNAWLFRASWQHVLFFLLGLLLILWLYFRLDRSSGFSQLLKTALLLPSFFWIVAGFIKPISYPDFGLQIVQNSKKIGVDLTEKNLLLYTKQQSGGKFRIASKGKTFVPHRTEREILDIPADKYVIYKTELKESYDTEGVEKQVIASYWGDLPYHKVIKARFDGTFEQIKQESASEYVIVWRNK